MWGSSHSRNSFNVNEEDEHKKRVAAAEAAALMAHRNISSTVTPNTVTESQSAAAIAAAARTAQSLLHAHTNATRTHYSSANVNANPHVNVNVPPVGSHSHPVVNVHSSADPDFFNHPFMSPATHNASTATKNSYERYHIAQEIVQQQQQQKQQQRERERLLAKERKRASVTAEDEQEDILTKKYIRGKHIKLEKAKEKGEFIKIMDVDGHNVNASSIQNADVDVGKKSSPSYMTSTKNKDEITTESSSPSNTAQEQQQTPVSTSPSSLKKSSRNNNDRTKDSILVTASKTTTPKTSGNNQTTTPSTTPSSNTSKKKRKSSSTTPSGTKKKSTKSTSTSSSSSQQKSSKTKSQSTSSVHMSLTSGLHPNLHKEVPKITDAEYRNLDALMAQFCKVPLLAEFSRPVSLLHPELMQLYSKVVKDPIDLGKVCRAIRRRQYTNTRQVCVDVWRIFANCVKYHTHPLTREGAIPSFVSIANHLREYFNALWMEYMLPSEIVTNGTSTDALCIATKNADEKRKKVRSERYNALVATLLSAKCVENAARAIEKFVEMEGRVDELDKDAINCANDDEKNSMESVFKALSSMASRLLQIAPSDIEYPVEALGNDLKRCIGNEVFQGCDALRMKLEKRLDRLLGKIIAPINEATCRGVNQSSVWGCMAAAIWARETTKRPYWPAIVLGILAPDDQSEDWHRFLTERNEARLPFKLLQGLQNGKKKAMQALLKQNEGKSERMSFFLVEFLGTHEFIWVREADIIENFDPDEDPNQIIAKSSGKKTKKSLRNAVHANSKILQKAIDEGRWALEEFELQLNDPCGDQIEEYAEDEENYSFPVLCESDDEADEADGGVGDENDLGDINAFGSPTGKLTDVEEIHELLFTDGALDYSTNGRKLAKKRVAAFKKQQVEAKKAAANLLKKRKEEKAKKLKNAKKSKASSSTSKASKETSKKIATPIKVDRVHDKELEKRRKKRERERVLKEKDEHNKRLKTGGNSLIRRGRKLTIADKRGRAYAIVRGYLHKMAAKSDLKSLGQSGVLSIPAAAVEGTGLLGMALAFRAAAGELEMPNSSSNSSNFKPWESIDVDGPQTSAERCANLEKKIKMIQKAMKSLKSNDERRKELIEAAKKGKEENVEWIMQAEKEARQNELPKRKPMGKKKGVSEQLKEEEKSLDSKDVVGDEASDDEDRSSIDLSSPVKYPSIEGSTN